MYLNRPYLQYGRSLQTNVARIMNTPGNVTMDWRLFYQYIIHGDFKLNGINSVGMKDNSAGRM